MRTAILHYSVPPVVGGVESVILAHTRLLLNAGYQVYLIAGAGEKSALPQGAELIRIPEMDSLHSEVLRTRSELDRGSIPENFVELTGEIAKRLEKALHSMDSVIVHNAFTKHFNLPLTAALINLLDERKIRNPIAWCHDFTWTSPHSRSRVYPGYPWDLLRTYRGDVTYVTVSRQRQEELAGLFECPLEEIKVIYGGVNPAELFSLSDEGQALLDRLDLSEADLVLLMPVRVTQAKNIELALQVVASLKHKGLHPKLIVSGPPDPHDHEDMQYYHQLLDLRKALQVEQEARFVYESGSSGGGGYTIGIAVLRELYRYCDAVIFPSHREGFGLPILEAGMIGIPVFSTGIPAAQEIGGQEVVQFSHDSPPEEVAELILSWSGTSKTYRLRQRIRQEYTWQAIFEKDIQPLLTRGSRS